MKQGLHYYPQNGTLLKQSIVEAIIIAKAIHNAPVPYSYIYFHYNDLVVVVNELSHSGIIEDQLSTMISEKYSRNNL